MQGTANDRRRRRLPAALGVALSVVVVSLLLPALAQAGNTLRSGYYLKSGYALYAANYQHKLVMQTDGNAVQYLTPNGRARWWTNTQGHGGSVIVMQRDGNLVVRSGGVGGSPIWNSRTAGHPGARLVVQNDGNLVIYDPNGRVLWHRSTYQYVRPSDRLRADNFATSPNGRYRLYMQSDGNLVVLNPNGSTRWSTHTSGRPNVWAVMQGDGNFVVYQMDPPCSSCLPPVRRTLFATNTQGHSGTFLAIQNDGNLVLYQGVGHSIWASNTGGG